MSHATDLSEAGNEALDTTPHHKHHKHHTISSYSKPSNSLLAQHYAKTGKNLVLVVDAPAFSFWCFQQEQLAQLSWKCSADYVMHVTTLTHHSPHSPLSTHNITRIILISLS